MKFDFKIGKKCFDDGYMHDNAIKYYFNFHLGLFRSHCFKDHGEWFLYFTRHYKDKPDCHGFRFSSAGFLRF
jgi:hypothetical protein